MEASLTSFAVTPMGIGKYAIAIIIAVALVLLALWVINWLRANLLPRVTGGVSA